MTRKPNFDDCIILTIDLKTRYEYRSKQPSDCTAMYKHRAEVLGELLELLMQAKLEHYDDKA